jgi:ABC-type transport system substrate-binding protein
LAAQGAAGEIELFSISDDSARINALLSGDVDLIPRLIRVSPIIWSMRASTCW